MLGRRAAVFFMLNVSPIICGPKSPITTKNAIQVPIRNIIMLNSTVTFPNFPNKWNAGINNINKLLISNFVKINVVAYLEIQNLVSSI